MNAIRDSKASPVTDQLLRRGLYLEYATLAWNVVGADSDEGGHLFQSDRGHPSNLMAAT
jgi:hypothetical protein